MLELSFELRFVWFQDWTQFPRQLTCNNWVSGVNRPHLFSWSLCHYPFLSSSSFFFKANSSVRCSVFFPFIVTLVCSCREMRVKILLMVLVWQHLLHIFALQRAIFLRLCRRHPCNAHVCLHTSDGLDVPGTELSALHMISYLILQQQQQ